jgi:hypothetical protein
VKSLFAQRQLYWPRWVLYQFLRFFVSLPLMLLAFVGFIGGAIALFCSSKLGNWAYKHICPLPRLPSPDAIAKQIVRSV